MTLLHRRSGFSFIELLIAMLVAVALYAVVAGPGEGYVRKQKLQRCIEHLRRQHLVLSLYANEHDGAFPALDGADAADALRGVLVPRYTTDTSFFCCPATGRAGDTRFDYAYVAGLRREAGATLLMSDAQVDKQPKLRGTRIFSDNEKTSGGNHGALGGNLLFADGHAQTIGTIAPRDISPAAGARLLNPQP